MYFVFISSSFVYFRVLILFVSLAFIPTCFTVFASYFHVLFSIVECIFFFLHMSFFLALCFCVRLSPMFMYYTLFFLTAFDSIFDFLCVSILLICFCVPLFLFHALFVKFHPLPRPICLCHVPNPYLQFMHSAILCAITARTTIFVSLQ